MTIKILDETNLPKNTCSVCMKKFNTHKTIPSNTYNGLFETQIKHAHSKCQRMYESREKIRQNLTNIEYKMYLLLNL